MGFWKWANSLKLHVKFCMFIFLGEKIFNFPKILKSSRIAAKKSHIQIYGKEQTSNMLAFVFSHWPCFGYVMVWVKTSHLLSDIFVLDCLFMPAG